MKAVVAAVLAAVVLHCAAGQTLYEYVHAPDASYSWFDTGFRYNETGWQGFMLNLTSQTWMTSAESSRPVWTHQLLVIVPDKINFKDTAAIYVTGGHNSQPPPAAPGPTDEDVLGSALLAMSTGTITATLWQIPAQPIVFAADPEHKERTEDAAVAFSWVQYMKTGDPTWILYWPMTKAVSKAMDAVTEYVSKEQGLDLEKFMVWGASKRGWITWLTGATDERVIAIAPVVMDLLNTSAGLEHMWKAYGGWTFAFEDYYAMNITRDMGSPELAMLFEQIDPLNYKANLTMPKLVIDATGDEFFMLDDDHYWWGELPGETLRLMIQNAEHTMATGVFELIGGLEAWYAAILTNSPRPSFTWEIENGSGNINMDVNTGVLTPHQVVLRFATTTGPERRDFRLIKGNTPSDPCKFIPVPVFGSACLNPIIWVGEDVAPTSTSTDANGDVVQHYVLSQPLPPSGWRAFMAELYFTGPMDTTFQLTTQVSIIPQTFPFPPCNGTACYGTLV